jgi:hypothetical protein
MASIYVELYVYVTTIQIRKTNHGDSVFFVHI